MPLIKGKSDKSFEKNVKTEIEHGKDPKQSLAIAYAVKRKAQRKAKGGAIIPKEDMAHEMDETVFEEQAEHNQDLHPGKGDAIKTKDIGQLHLDKKAQSHEVISEPAEPKEHVMPKKENLPSQMLAKGGHVMMVMNPEHIVKAVMAKKMAQGEELEPSEDYLALNDSYPDVDETEFDMLDPEVKQMAEGGPLIDQDKWKKIAEGMGNVKAQGGDIKPDRKHLIKKIFSKLK